jgi:hypothetical protein
MATSKATRIKGKVGVPPILKKGGPMEDKSKRIPRKVKHKGKDNDEESTG